MERKITSIIAIAFIYLTACSHEPASPHAPAGYPADIAEIIVTKCAVEGCHNNQSHENAAGLNLSTWQDMFLGAGTGSVVIPHRPDFSPLCFFTNSFRDLGICLEPTMPLNQAPLTRAEYLRIHNWIAAGAKNADGQIMFGDSPLRKKIYVANRLCDVVTVLDAGTLLQMRYVDVGVKQSKEFPYCLKVAPDKRHWYVSFFAESNVVQQFSATDDQLTAAIYLGSGMWTSFEITSDSRYGYFVDNSGEGKIVYADLVEKKLLATYTFEGGFQYPAGIATNEQAKKIYTGTLYGNFIYSIDVSDPQHPKFDQICIDGTNTITAQSSTNPVELLSDPLSGKCYVACSGSRDIRVLDMTTNSLVAIIPLGNYPAFLSLSQKTQRLFVSCPDDQTSFPGNRGAVYVIDLKMNSVVKRINSGYQPYGLVVDDDRGLAAVANANISSEGPDSHHISGCGEKNGNVSFIDLNTLELLHGIKREVAAFPCAITSR